MLSAVEAHLCTGNLEAIAAWGMAVDTVDRARRATMELATRQEPDRRAKERAARMPLWAADRGNMTMVKRTTTDTDGTG